MTGVGEPVMVVSIGADGWDGLAPAARRAVAEAEVLLGSRRQLDLIGAAASELVGLGAATPAERIEWPSPMLPALPGLFEELRARRVCALASGDPMFYGLGATLCRVLGADRVRVLPHPSSVSLACARLGWAVHDVTVLSGVARPLERLARVLAPGRRLLVLVAPTDGTADGPAAVAGLLTSHGYGPSLLTVLEQLGGPAERVVAARADGWVEPPGDPLVLVAVQCEPAADTVPLAGVPGLPDDAYEHDGQLTKREIRAITLARLAPLPGQLLWDVGGGAGSIAIEWLRSEPTARAITVERDPGRAARIGRNASRLGVPELTVVTGPAPGALAGLEPPDTVFVGGGLSAPGVLDVCWTALRPGGRLVVNTVTLEGEALLLEYHQRHGGSLTRIEIQRAGPVGGLTTWRPALPVTQWVVDSRC
ncbi:MAG: precorrin-6y C5,15-methyltransferase (decarboxylating) subunit CbiE [Pseudonocardia sp.]